MQNRWTADASHSIVEGYGHLSSESVVSYTDLSLGNMRRTVVLRAGTTAQDTKDLSSVRMTEQVEHLRPE